MTEFIRISKNKLQELITIAYKNDDELLSKYHVCKFSLEEAVHSTLEMVTISEGELQLKFYKVEYNDTPIGYVITSGNHLYSFGIAIEYRVKKVLSEWWDKLKKILGEKFTCLLFSNNERAIGYLQRRGMVIEWQSTEHKDLNEVLLKY